MQMNVSPLIKALDKVGQYVLSAEFDYFQQHVRLLLSRPFQHPL